MASDTKPLRLHPHEQVAPRCLLTGLRAPICWRSVALSRLSTALRLLWNSVFADFPSNGRSPENMASDRKPVRLHPHEHVAPLCLLARLRVPLCSRSVALSHLSTALRLLWNSAFADFPCNGGSPLRVLSDRKPIRLLLCHLGLYYFDFEFPVALLWGENTGNISSITGLGGLF